MFALISFTILFSYTAYYLSRVGLLPSHSDSYLALGKQGWMFQVSLFLTALLLMIDLLEVTPDPFKFTALLIELRANARAEINRLEGEIEELREEVNEEIL